MLTDDCLYTFCGVVMQLTFILKTGAADWAILQLMTSIDRKTGFWWLLLYISMYY
jgi:di/tricarboxylate transporter